MCEYANKEACVVVKEEGREGGSGRIMPPTVLTCSKKKDNADDGVDEGRRRDT